MYALNESDQLMLEQYADSDYIVNPTRAKRIRIQSRTVAIVTKVGEKTSDPVTEFIRFLITEWETAGKKLYVLAKEAGLAKSMPSQIKAKTSDASFYSATKLAGPFGYADFPELVVAAYQWWHSDRSTRPAGSAESAQAEAVRLARKYAVTPKQIARVLERYPLPEYAHADGLWWLSRLHEERTLEAEQDRALLAMSREATATAKRTAKKQGELREVAEQKADQRDEQKKAEQKPKATRSKRHAG